VTEWHDRSCASLEFVMTRTPATFHERLRAAIDDSGRTQGEVAEEVGAHPNQVSQWVNGRGKPDSRHLINLANALGVDLNWLLLGRGHTPPRRDRERELARRLTELAPQLTEVVKLAQREAN
jgi:transcriptional regulator with XRE-family HTH domain